MNVSGWVVVAYLALSLLIAFRIGWVFSEELGRDDVSLATFAIVMAALWPVGVVLYGGSLLSRKKPSTLGMGED